MPNSDLRQPNIHRQTPQSGAFQKALIDRRLVQNSLEAMCIPLKQHFHARRKTNANRKAAALELNDHLRTNEDLLVIALKKASSVNSLTHRDPTKVAVAKKESTANSGRA